MKQLRNLGKRERYVLGIVGLLALMCMALFLSAQDDRGMLINIACYKDGEIVEQFSNKGSLSQNSVIYNGVEVDAVAIGTAVNITNNGTLDLTNGSLVYRYYVTKTASPYAVLLNAPYMYEMRHYPSYQNKTAYPSVPSTHASYYADGYNIGDALVSTSGWVYRTCTVSIPKGQTLTQSLDCMGFSLGSFSSGIRDKGLMTVSGSGLSTVKAYPFVLDFGVVNEAWTIQTLQVTEQTNNYTVWVDVAVLDSQGAVIQKWEATPVASMTLKKGATGTYSFTLSYVNNGEGWTV